MVHRFRRRKARQASIKGMANARATGTEREQHHVSVKPSRLAATVELLSPGDMTELSYNAMTIPSPTVKNVSMDHTAHEMLSCRLERLTMAQG